MQQYHLAYGHAQQGETLAQINIQRLKTQIRQLGRLKLLDNRIDVSQTMVFDLYPQALVVDKKQATSMNITATTGATVHD